MQGSTQSSEIRLPADGASGALGATLTRPVEGAGLVLFAHGSGSSRYSGRNRYVASVLAERGLGTLLMDLLTEEEESEDVVSARWRFDIPLLARRVVEAMDWIRQHDAELLGNGLGLFGASTGAAAALIAAAERSAAVRTVVSRGGRPDLAGDALARVRCPVLLIVGGNDDVVLGLNRAAARELGGEARLYVVPGATHLFEEPGALEEVAHVAADWFGRELGVDSPPAARGDA